VFDRFHRKINYLRISVTDLCNLRCVYCMPASGVPLKRHEDILSFEEIEALTKVAVNLGIDKVRLTGGEPLVRRNILELVRRLGKLQGILDFAMTTNGVFLPQYALALKEAGLHRVNISLDCLDPKHFSELTRGGSVTDTLAGIEAALATGFRQVKINCVVNESPDEPQARDVATYCRERGLEVRFIRKMDTAKGDFWRVIGGEGGHCDICNRIRVSSDGHVFPCLFSNLKFSIREFGPEQAMRLAIENKPIRGQRSQNKFYALGG